MALTAPFDILADWPGWTLSFDLLWRQEQSRQANGVTRVKDLGPPLWRTSVTSKTLTRPVLDYWRARMNALENGLQTFKGYSLSRCWPIKYPGGSWPTTTAFNGVSASVASINDNNKAITVSGLPAGFILSVGDFIQIGANDLHQVMETATADGTGLTPEFEVRPHLWPVAAVSDAVSVKRPFCLMTLVPGTLSSAAGENGLGRVTFDAIEART